MWKESESQSVALSRLGEERQPSTNLLSTSGLVKRLRKGRDTRSRFVESHLNKSLAFQIRSLREREEWSQQTLAERVEMTQNAISRLENPNYGKATLTTLKRLAEVFDVGLEVRFVPFSKLVKQVSGTPFLETGLSPEQFSIESFASEEQSGTFDDRDIPDNVLVMPSMRSPEHVPELNGGPNQDLPSKLPPEGVHQEVENVAGI